MTSQTFSYDSLPLGHQEFRIFELLPASSPRDFIDIRLIKVSIQDPPPVFHALSYVWGDPDSELNEPQSIFIDGQTLQITKSLERALIELRTTDSTVAYWADQICINQAKENDEKPKQLKIMANIFRMSASTIAWIGSETPSSIPAMEALKQLSQDAHNLGITGLDPEQFRRMHFMRGDVRGIPDAHEDASSTACRNRLQDYVQQNGATDGISGLENILDFCNSDYFVRGWIREEVVLPKILIFRWGSASIHVGPLCEAITLLVLYIYQDVAMRREANRSEDAGEEILLRTSSITQLVHSALAVRNQYHLDSNTRFFSLAFILYKCRRLRFTKARDRVYGVFGMSNDWTQLGIEPDYSKDVTAEDIITDTAKKIIQKPVQEDDWLGGVNFMSFCELTPTEEPQAGVTQLRQRLGLLPSWVPRLDQFENNPSTPPTLAEEITTTSSRPFHASRGFPHQITDEEQFSAGQNVLVCEGVIVDTIKIVGRRVVAIPDPSGNDGLDFTHALADIRKFAKDSYQTVRADWESTHPFRALEDQEKLASALWRVPILDHEFHDSPLASRRATTWSKDGYYAHYGRLTRQTPDVDVKRLNYIEQLAALKTRRPFLGVSGFVGVGPKAMQGGDLVCVIRGGSFPFILRKKQTDSDEDRYCLVGEAFCDGVMDGEAFQRNPELSKVFRLE